MFTRNIAFLYSEKDNELGKFSNLFCILMEEPGLFTVRYDSIEDLLALKEDDYDVIFIAKDIWSKKDLSIVRKLRRMNIVIISDIELYISYNQVKSNISSACLVEDLAWR